MVVVRASERSPRASLLGGRAPRSRLTSATTARRCIALTAFRAGLPKRTLHCTCHEHATLMIASGADIRLVLHTHRAAAAEEAAPAN